MVINTSSISNLTNFGCFMEETLERMKGKTKQKADVTCGRQNTGLAKDVYSLITGTHEYVSYGKQNFSDVIKVKDLDLGCLFSTIWMDPI